MESIQQICDCALLAAKPGFEKHENGGKVAYELGYQLFFLLNASILEIEHHGVMKVIVHLGCPNWQETFCVPTNRSACF